jgi:hypothetical protein
VINKDDIRIKHIINYNKLILFLNEGFIWFLQTLLYGSLLYFCSAITKKKLLYEGNDYFIYTVKKKGLQRFAEIHADTNGYAHTVCIVKI